MKKGMLFLLLQWATIGLMAQLKTTRQCPVFNVDLLEGRVNGLEANSTNGQIKSLFPCYTATEDETASSRCGGSVFYADKDIFFYTGRDYVEIGERFKGKLSIPLLGAARNSLFKTLGHPKLKDLDWDAYQTAYGTLVLYFNKSSKVRMIRFSTNSTELLTLCE